MVICSFKEMFYQLLKKNTGIFSVRKKNYTSLYSYLLWFVLVVFICWYKFSSCNYIYSVRWWRWKNIEKEPVMFEGRETFHRKWGKSVKIQNLFSEPLPVCFSGPFFYLRLSFKNLMLHLVSLSLSYITMYEIPTCTLCI